MFSTLKTLFGKDPATLAVAQQEFLEMLSRTNAMFADANRGVWEAALSATERAELYRSDRRVNKLERSVRRRVLVAMNTHGSGSDLNSCVLLLHVVKDAERIGDYCKNLSELRDYDARDLGDDQVSATLRMIADEIQEIFVATPAVMRLDGEIDAAVELLQSARELCKRCDQQLLQIAKSDKDPSAVTVLVLLTRFYKRIAAHLSNVLSAAVMPLHKLDYFDEAEIEGLTESGK
jgi:phosphate uptake regulator